MKKNKQNLSSLGRRRNIARERLHKVMSENDQEWQFAKELLKHTETLFVTFWEAYKTDRGYIEDKFFMCCDQLLLSIYEEQKTSEKFKKIYKPYYDKFQKLNGEYQQVKIQQKKKGAKS